jgi:hypothetical protein
MPENNIGIFLDKIIGFCQTLGLTPYCTTKTQTGLSRLLYKKNTGTNIIPTNLRCNLFIHLVVVAFLWYILYICFPRVSTDFHECVWFIWDWANFRLTWWGLRCHILPTAFWSCKVLTVFWLLSYVSMYTYTHAHTRAHTHKHTNAYMYTRARHGKTHTHTHTHTQTRARLACEYISAQWYLSLLGKLKE